MNRKALTTLVLATACPLFVDASVLSEAKYWLRTPYDANKDGCLSNQAGELFDTTRAGDSSSGLNVGKSDAANDNLGAVQIVREDVLNPYDGTIEKNVPCLKMTASPKEVDGQMRYRPATVSLPSLFDFRYDNNYTFYLRFFYDGRFKTGSTESAWNMFLQLGLSQVSGGGGSGFGFGPKNANNWLFFNFGGKAVDLYVGEFAPGKWVDVVGVMSGTDQKLTLYFMTALNSVVEKTIDYPSTTATVSRPYGSNVKLGSSNDSTWSPASSSLQSFNGSVAQLAIWNRALTKDEAIEVVSERLVPEPEVYDWRVGFDNGSASEFAGLNSGTTWTPSCNDGWLGLPNSLTENGDAFKVAFSFNRYFPISNTNAARSVAIVAKMAPDSGVGVFSPVVNGHALKDVAYGPGQVVVMIADKTYMQNDNLLELSVKSGTAAKIDCISGGLSWNIGYRNSSYALDGFAGQGSTVHVLGAPNFSKFAKCTTGPNNGNCSVRFDLNMPEELVGKLRFDVDVRQNHSSNPPKVENAIVLNGTVLKTYGLTGDFSDTVVRVKSNQLQAGVNHFVLQGYNRESTDGSWDPIDCVTVSPVGAEPGLILVVR